MSNAFTKGSLILLLHAHLPYVRHPEHEYFLEENWLYEAAVETYIPLAEMLERLTDDGCDFGIALSLSPTLLEMSEDALLKSRLLGYIDNLLCLCEKEIARNKKDPDLSSLSRFYFDRINKAKSFYEKNGMMEPFYRLARAGRIELLTTAATHAFLPALSPFPQAVKAQIHTGVETFKRHFGEASAGFWLPECGYYDALDRILSEAGIKYFFLDAHGVLNGAPRAEHGVFTPVLTPSGLAAFGRDGVLSKRIWCSKTGYPGDPRYRDFYRDIGYDLPEDYLKPFMHPEGIRTFTGLKYHRVTGDTDKKEPYKRPDAMRTVKVHAADFIKTMEGRAVEIGAYGFHPVFTLPFDAELFGHWWFEGVEWLECLIKGIARSKTIRMTTPSEYLSETPALQESNPSFSSWGHGGYSGPWVNPSNDKHLVRIHKACRKMEKILLSNSPFKPSQQRILRQASRELLLAQSSDWPFMINTGTARQYAEGRIKGHLDAFDRLCGMIKNGPTDTEHLSALERKNNLFPWINPGAAK